ncbi:MAG TPA: hypothetical protein DDY82_02540 [Clostridiales bacterium]|nr:hypothetical protein [Clostridiales bacterium]
MSKKKKIIILSCMIALLAVTAVFNFILTDNGVKETSTTTANYFTQYKTERATTRNEEILQLNQIIASENATQEAKTDALNMKLKLTNAMENELMLEYLLKTQGFENVAVTCGTTNDNVNVIVQNTELSQDDAIKIYSIILEQLKVSPENVNIIPMSK